MDFPLQLPLRVLGIFPTPSSLPPLNWLAEIGELTALYGVELTVLTGKSATINEITHHLRAAAHQVVLWSGHGAAGALLDSDNVLLSGATVAAQLRPAAPYCAVISACFSGGRDDLLQSITEEISAVGIHAVGFLAEVTDRTVLIYQREFLRSLVSGAGFAGANRSALQALRQQAGDPGRVIIVPALVDGLHMILNRLDSHGQRLTAIEQTLVAINLKLST